MGGDGGCDGVGLWVKRGVGFVRVGGVDEGSAAAAVDAPYTFHVLTSGAGQLLRLQAGAGRTKTMHLSIPTAQIPYS